MKLLPLGVAEPRHRSRSIRRLLLLLMLLTGGTQPCLARLLTLEGHLTQHYSNQEYYHYLIVANGIPASYREHVEELSATMIGRYLRNRTAAVPSRSIVPHGATASETAATDQAEAGQVGADIYDAILQFSITSGTPPGDTGDIVNIEEAIRQARTPATDTVPGVLYDTVIINLLDRATGDIVWTAQGKLTAWSDQPSMQEQTAKLMARWIGKQLFSVGILYSQHKRDKILAKQAHAEQKRLRREEKLRMKQEIRNSEKGKMPPMESPEVAP